jgi:FAD dependent oxidoreductase TIGR03364
LDRKRSNYLIIAPRLHSLPSLIRTIETDVCVVGAGIIGLAHALEARRRGLSVVVLERGARATGASVRDSGHLFFSGLGAGDALGEAPLGRELWLELARRAGIPVDTGGTLIVARHQDELAVLEAAAADPARQARMRSTKKIAKLAPIPVDTVLGGFHAKQDLRIDSRAAPAALARLLIKDADAHVEWGAHVHEIEPGVVYAGALRVRAQAIVVCAGAHGRTLPAGLWPRASGLRLRETQMLRVAAPTGQRFRQTLMTGLSLLEHPAFWACDGIEHLRKRLELESPELVERGVSLAVTQLRNGGVTLGSTSAYTDAPKLYARERLDSLLLAEAQALLGGELDVRQRWRSTSAGLEASAHDYLVSLPMPTVRVVHALRSTAVALCHSRAQTVLDQLLGGPPSASEYIRVQDMRSAAAIAGASRDNPSAFGKA